MECDQLQSVRRASGGQTVPSLPTEVNLREERGAMQQRQALGSVSEVI